MYSSFHGNVGAAITAASFLIIKDPNVALLAGCTIAFASHFLMDCLNEIQYETKEKTIICESLFLLSFLLIAFLSGHFFIMIAGWIFANIPDMIDKGVILKLFNKQIMPCHQTYWKRINLNDEKYSNYILTSWILLVVASVV